MIYNLKQNIQLYALLAVWVIFGIYGGGSIYVILPLSLILLRRQNAYQELLLGFFFILILSDNLSPAYHFASNVKNFYILLLGIFFILDADMFSPLNKIYKLFIPFFLFSLYCLIFSPAFAVGIQKTLSYLLVIMVVPNYFTRCFREKGLDFFKNIIYLGVFILVLGFFSALIKKDFAFIDEGRFRGMFGNPNGLGLFCFVFFGFTFSVNYMYPDLFTRNEKRFIFALILISVLLSNSRNALMGILILYILIWCFKYSIGLGFIFSIILVFLSFLISEQIPVIIRALSLENYLRLNTLQELSGRAVAWHFAWGKIQDNFFVGKGFGYDEFIMRKNYAVLSRLGHQGGVHNSFISLWLNFGLIGLIIYFCSFVSVFLKSAKVTALAFPIMFAVIFSSTFEGLLIGSLNPHMFLLLMIFTLITETEMKNRKIDTTAKIES